MSTAPTPIVYSRGVATGGTPVYTPPQSVYLNVCYVVVFPP